MKVKEEVLKGVHSHPHTNKTHSSPTFWQPRVPRKSTAWRNKLGHFAIIKFPRTTESAMNKTEDDRTLVFTVDVKANRYQSKQAV